jgi:hypothetical protein
MSIVSQHMSLLSHTSAHSSTQFGLVGSGRDTSLTGFALGAFSQLKLDPQHISDMSYGQAGTETPCTPILLVQNTPLHGSQLLPTRLILDALPWLLVCQPLPPPPQGPGLKATLHLDSCHRFLPAFSLRPPFSPFYSLALQDRYCQPRNLPRAVSVSPGASHCRSSQLVSCSPSLKATATSELSPSSGQEQSKDQEEPNDLISGDT